MSFRTLDDLDLKGRRVLIRVDINVPVRDGRVTDDTRIRAVLPTIRDVMAKGGLPILLAHFGRPKGKPLPEMSLGQVVDALHDALGGEAGPAVLFAPDCVGPHAEEAAERLGPGQVLLLENTRFHAGEEANDPAFVEALARVGEVYVNDAFSAAHRAHASTEGLAHRLPAAAGRLMEAELRALEKALASPERPVIAVVGGAKVSTKLELLGNLIGKADQIVIGGGMANTFLAAQGKDVGKSLCEHDLAPTAREILGRATAAGCEIVLPADVVVAREFKAGAPSEVVPADACPPDAMILDAGPEAVRDIVRRFEGAKTVVWNGPLGAFEIEPFNRATDEAASAAARLTEEGRLLTVAGGGDTVAALNASGAAAKFTYVSTAGGAFLEWLEGKTLPGVAALTT
ncbi:phosphoglycerate kinase [Limibaculum sp. FT325]|uniref:phosphoglycerate kinase n=1 Tax=Thermohalobaculum sediminis TaxID=2939436 RepID=UPI0020C0596A|nr:phosphoglycerate kinase [Limibaculum sediminis]MCL5775703.1 phosphoglycerate kinase [Limibaculum sediminis]